MKLNVVGSNQTELVKADGTTVFFSYNTPVAVFVPGYGALCSSTKYSRTTSKHATQALNRWGATKNFRVTQEEINRYVD